MKSKSKYITYCILLILIVGVAYTACKNVIPDREHIEQAIELKLSK